ncbi:MAG: helix-turn-helix domain-containing protein [Chloroflexi bacterium]|nr:helix-turn-helix domain-containing protein [Chloroflexota bacterium]
MLHARTLTDEERKQLRRMARCEVGRVSQRATLILLSGRNKNVSELSEIFGMSRASVRLWIHRFNQHSAAGLYDEERCGRPHSVQAD